MGRGRRDPDPAEIDPAIYDYDAAYDAMQSVKEAKKAELKKEAAAGKPRYMESLLKSADTRKRDQLRAKDKMLQKEREAEGDEFADKEKFVTGAYKRQQEEMRKLEEEEKLREAEEAKKKRATGMQGFYRSVIDSDEKRHQEAMAAAAEVAKKGPKTLDDGPREKTDAELAAEINAKGGKVILNDDGQVADKRQLLTSGLNVISKPGKSLSSSLSSGGARSYEGRQTYQRSNVAELRANRDRQTQLVQEQLEQAAKRAADEEAEEQRKREHAAKSRKTKEEISSARERYLQRKKEAAAAAAASR